MGWIQKKQKSEETVAPKKSAPAPNTSGLTVLGPSFSMEGEVRSGENMMISGNVKGVIHCDQKVTVAESGLVEGEIHAANVVVMGEIKGDAFTSESVTIEPTGRLIGDITTPSLSHKPGGFFQGYSHMVPERKGPKPKHTGKKIKSKGPEVESDDSADAAEEGKE